MHDCFKVILSRVLTTGSQRYYHYVFLVLIQVIWYAHCILCSLYPRFVYIQLQVRWRYSLLLFLFAMGIHGLWTYALTVSVQSTVLLKDYRGKTIGVNASNWFYRAAYIQSKQSGKTKNRQERKSSLFL